MLQKADLTFISSGKHQETQQLMLQLERVLCHNKKFVIYKFVNSITKHHQLTKPQLLFLACSEYIDRFWSQSPQHTSNRLSCLLWTQVFVSTGEKPPIYGHSINDASNSANITYS